MINSKIISILKGFKAGGETVPVAFLHYSGSSEKFITFQETGAEALYAANNRRVLIHSVDFDIFSRGSYAEIETALIDWLEGAGARLQVALCSGDLYESDTGFYHKTLCFEFVEYLKEKESEEE